MSLPEEQTFVENPYSTGIFTTVIMATVFIIIVLILINIGEIPPHSKFAKQGIKTVEGAITFLFFIFLVVILVLWFAISFSKKKTITFQANGCLILAKSFWSSGAEETHFFWRDVTEMRVKVGYKGVKSFVVTRSGEELSLMTETLFNKKSFRNLVKEATVRKTLAQSR